MRAALLLLLCPVLLQAAEQDHSAHTVDTAPAVDHSTHGAAAEPAAALPPLPVPPEDSEGHAHLMAEHGASLNFLLLGERFEHSDDDLQLWELQGWLGYDRDKLWLKTEGAYDSAAHETEHGEVQLLYSRAIAPFWDLQAGLRHDDVGGNSRAQAALGLMGLAPYWFEVDAAAFVSEDGDLSTRVEAEYELRFTQRLLLQPRVELNYSFADTPELQIGKGLSEASFGLRLRYEVLREFAPYLGVEWSRAYGNTAGLLRAAGTADTDTRVVVGLRFWY